MSKDTKLSSPSSSNKRGATQKRVVSVPIKDVQRLTIKGLDHQISSPPSDSWAWRKYGQKPIKGSPYPRGYYKCSSSKGCPARKQVERSKMDPNMLVITYSCEHNHTCPDSKINDHRHAAATATSVSEEESEDEEEEEENEEKPKSIVISDQSREIISEDTELIANDNNIGQGHEFGLFSDLEYSTSFTMLECPILTGEDMKITTDMIFTTMIEEDDSLIFSGLGVLPECAKVFQSGG